MALRDVDELLHAPPASVERWQENFFFILWDTATQHGFMVHLQRIPALGWQEAQAVVSIGGRLGSATLRRPFLADGGVPEVAMEPIEPWRQWRLRGDFPGTVGRGPLGFLFTEASGPDEIGLDVTLESTLVPADFGEGLRQVVGAMQRESSGPQMTHAEHYEQGGTWHGRLRIGDDEVEAAGLFVRDHSWGPRNEQNAFKAFWTASCLDGGRVFCNAIGIPQRDKVAGVGVLVDEQGARFTSEVSARYEPAPGVCSYERSVVRYGAGIDLELAGTTQVHIPMYLPHSGPRRYDNNAISEVTMDGKTGFGVLEWADVLEPDQDAEVAVSGLASDDLPLVPLRGA